MKCPKMGQKWCPPTLVFGHYLRILKKRMLRIIKIKASDMIGKILEDFSLQLISRQLFKV